MNSSAVHSKWLSPFRSSGKLGEERREPFLGIFGKLRMGSGSLIRDCFHPFQSSGKTSWAPLRRFVDEWGAEFEEVFSHDLIAFGAGMEVVGKVLGEGFAEELEAVEVVEVGIAEFLEEFSGFPHLSAVVGQTHRTGVWIGFPLATVDGRDEEEGCVRVLLTDDLDAGDEILGEAACVQASSSVDVDSCTDGDGVGGQIPNEAGNLDIEMAFTSKTEGGQVEVLISCDNGRPSQSWGLGRAAVSDGASIGDPSGAVVLLDRERGVVVDFKMLEKKVSELGQPEFETLVSGGQPCARKLGGIREVDRFEKLPVDTEIEFGVLGLDSMKLPSNAGRGAAECDAHPSGLAGFFE